MSECKEFECLNNNNKSKECECLNNNSRYKECECMNNNNKENREALTKQIMELKFAIIDVSLYLNAHPKDNRALCLHNEYTKRFKELTDKYQKVYGPLTIEFPCNKWRWLEMPWPWEKGAY